MRRWLIAPFCFGACAGCGIDEGSLQASEPSEDSLLVGQYLFVSKSEDMPVCPPGSYALLHNISPLARAIANGEPFSLENDSVALGLLDSMCDGTSATSRRFHFWVVTRSLKRSDGYYSEGVGNMGSRFLLERPEEFLTAWAYCIDQGEQLKWAYYLAAEEHIGSEGHPPAFILADYRLRLDSVAHSLSEPLVATKDRLMMGIDSIYRVLAQNDQPLRNIPSNGTYTYDIAFAEWAGKSLGAQCNVTIIGDSIRVVYNGVGSLTAKKGHVLDEGRIMMHKSGKWIIAHEPNDVNAPEVGGCDDGPSVIDFEGKKFWTC